MRDAGLLIRRESALDRAAIRLVHETAFGRAVEADLVDQLVHDQAVIASFAAELDQCGVVGHVLFSRLWLETADEDEPSVALAPLAVLPAHQRRQPAGDLRSGRDETPG
jgi:putative acetyltransferase